MTHPRSFLVLLTVGLFTLGSAGVALGEDDDDERGEGPERGERMERGGAMESRAPLASPVNATYQQECGSCHMAYQPGLLPPRAWAQIMESTALANHYGDDASLADALRTEISTFLGANSADLALQSNPHRVNTEASTSSTELPRITATAAFRSKHDEIPQRLVKDNPKVGSLSQCNACHPRAAEGDYNEGQIDIPGHGAWKD